jgi:hypothetical protein
MVVEGGMTAVGEATVGADEDGVMELAEVMEGVAGAAGAAGVTCSLAQPVMDRMT